MDVRCPKCQTLYEVDDRRLRKKRITLRCSSCSNVFQIESPIHRIRTDLRRWMVRKTATGDLLYFGSFDELHAWIMSENVCGQDQITRTEKVWTALSEIPEFIPVFQAVDSIASMREGRVQEPVLDRKPDGSSSPRPRSGTSVQYGKADRATRVEGAETTVPSGLDEISEASTPDTLGPPKSIESSDVVSKSSVGPDIDHVWDDIDNSLEWRVGDTDAPSPAKPAFVDSADNGWDIEGEEYDEEEEIISEVSDPGMSKLGLVVCFVVLVGGAFIAYQYFGDGATESAVGAPESGGVAEIDSASRPGPSTEGEKMGSRIEENSLQLAASVADRRGEALEMASKVVSEVVFRSFQTVLATEVHDVPATIRRATRALENGRLNKAKKLFTKAVEQAPKNAKALTGLGWTYLEMGQIEAGIRQFKKALKQKRTDGDAYIGLGTAERRRGNIRAAFEAYDRYLGRFPRGRKASIARHQGALLRKQLGK
jgi:predicted Zn finger-like uncharacterized protein